MSKLNAISERLDALEARVKPDVEPTLPSEVAAAFLEAFMGCHKRTGSRKVSMAAAWVWAQEVQADLDAGLDVKTRPRLSHLGEPTADGAHHVERILAAVGWDFSRPPKASRQPPVSRFLRSNTT